MRFHVLGLGPIGSLVAHHLCKTLDAPRHSVVLIHKNLPQLKKARLAGNVLRVERDGVVETSKAFRSEIFEASKQLRYEKRQENLFSRLSLKSENEGAASPESEAKDLPQTSVTDNTSPIESLIVSLKAYTVVDAVKALVPRLTPNSTIVLLHNGMGVYERLAEDIFRNPEQRPHFIVTSIDHGAWNKHYFHTVHAGVGSIAFGIVADPRGRGFEGSVAEDIPIQERQLSLDDIMSPEGGDDSRYLSLRNTVAALSGLSELHAVWQPISHIETAMKRKLVVNSVVNPLTALMGCRNGELLESAESKKIINRVCLEAAGAFALQALPECPRDDRVREYMIKSGLSRVPPALTAGALEKECLRVIQVTAGNISSMLSDVRAGSYTEIDYMNGYLVGLGRSLGLPMITTATLLNLIKLRTAIPLDHLIYK
jgi:2-dehydropantoate 2-reductase